MNTKLFLAASTAALLLATAAAAQATMTVTNDGEVAIVGLAISGESSDDFGDNLLDEEIAPGEGVEVTFDVGDDCVQDVQATYEDGDTEEVMGVDLCEGGDFEIEDEDGSEEDGDEEEGDEEE
jgi:opacity protein-like surface antigen